MDELQSKAVAFSKLLNIQYRIILGRKCKAYEMTINFEPFDFPHLIGLHKLTDIINGHISNDAMFDSCINGKLTYDRISSSVNFDKLGNRFEYFDRIEEMLDRNDTVYKCNARTLSCFSKIKADYQMKNQCDGLDFYLFLQHRGTSDTYYCKSFFNDNAIDYTYGQTKMTLLYKEKINTASGEITVQYDRSKN